MNIYWFSKLLFGISLLSVIAYCDDFIPIYKTKSSNCNVIAGDLLLIQCPTYFEAHNQIQIVSSGLKATYTSFLKQNSVISNGISYQKIDESQKISYISNETVYSVEINDQTNLIQSIQSDTYSFKSLAEAVQLDQIGIYKDSYDNQILFRDRQSNTNFAKTLSISGLKLNFKVSKGRDSVSNYDLLACTKSSSTNDRCQIHEIQTGDYPIVTTVNYRYQFNLQTGQCAQNQLLTEDYVVISCPKYQNSSGQVLVYSRNQQDFNLTLILTETGNYYPSGMDYFNLGSSIDFVRLNDQHTVIFYTAQLTYKGRNLTYINTIQLLKMSYNNIYHYKTLITINQYSYKANNFLNKGSLKLSASNSYLLSTFEKLIQVFAIPICHLNSTVSGVKCQKCEGNYFASGFNSQNCTRCNDTFPTSSFESLVRIIYCNSATYNFVPSIYTFQSQKLIIPFEYYSDSDDTYFSAYDDNTTNITSTLQYYTISMSQGQYSKISLQDSQLNETYDSEAEMFSSATQSLDQTLMIIILSAVFAILFFFVLPLIFAILILKYKRMKSIDKIHHKMTDRSMRFSRTTFDLEIVEQHLNSQQDYTNYTKTYENITSLGNESIQYPIMLVDAEQLRSLNFIQKQKSRNFDRSPNYLNTVAGDIHTVASSSQFDQTPVRLTQQNETKTNFLDRYAQLNIKKNSQVFRDNYFMNRLQSSDQQIRYCDELQSEENAEEVLQVSEKYNDIDD